MKKKLFAFVLAGALGLGCLSGCGGAHILAAEDNNLDMEILHFFLEDLNCVVTEARDGQKAVDTFRREPAGTFQLILMDVMMPNLDGLEAAHQIRTMGKEDSRTIPIVAASANADRKSVV